MIAALCVGAGGFCGAIARYLLGLLPYQGQFPLITFVINFTGAVVIGAVLLDIQRTKAANRVKKS